MDNDRRSAQAAPYDYRKYDRIWQRVAPSLSPYPGMASLAEAGDQTAEVPSGESGLPVPAAEARLPGAEPNPCCMGTQAQDSLAVLEGFIEDEQSSRRYFQAFARQAPAAARPMLWEAARMTEDHIRRLLAVYYLITGQCYRPAVSCERIRVGSYCTALRERYHEAACQWMNYTRAAEGTADPCLQRTFEELAADQQRLSRMLEELLGRALTGTCGQRGMGV